jgi:hypothetical protein
LLHDEQCTTGGAIFEPELHLQQTLPLLCPKPYKHPKTTKLNPKTPWMKQNYKKIININYYFFLLSMNHFKFMEIQYIYQLLCPTYFSGLSIPIFDIPCHPCRAYVEWVNQIICYKFSSFSICDVTFQSTLPTP